VVYRLTLWGSVVADEVRASTEDLGEFVDRGQAYLASLRAIFEDVAAARSRVSGVLGGDGALPVARVALSGYGGTDSFAELLAEAGYNNGFVAEVRDALLTATTEDGIGSAPIDVVSRALIDAGFSLSGADVSLAEDEARLASIDRQEQKERIREDIETVLAEARNGGDGYEPYEALGMSLDAYLGSLAGTDGEHQALVAEVMIEMGVEYQASAMPGTTDGYLDRELALMLVTQGVRLLPSGEAGELVDRLSAERVRVPSGGTRSALELAVDALDLDEDLSLFQAELVGPSWHGFVGDSQPYFRQHALDKLVNASLTDDGEISEGGQHLVDYVLDTYPGVVARADDPYLIPLGDRWETAADFDLRATLATALAAPNYGLTEAQYAAALRVDEIDGLLADPGSLSDAEFELLWLERRVRASELAGHDPDAMALVTEAMLHGLSAADAARIATSAGDPDAMNDRVRRLRVVYETSPFGRPVQPGQLERLDVDDDVASSLMVELLVLQATQEALYREGKPDPNVPLDQHQLELLAAYVGYEDMVHHFAGGWALGHEEAMRLIAAGDDASIHDLPDELRDLAIELAKPENAIVWELMAGAADNDTFLAIDGYQPNDGRDRVTVGDSQALLAQMMLVASLGPHQGDLDLDGDGTVHEDEVSDWLDANRNNPGVPPSIIDQIEAGQRVGLGEDTFGWDEIGDLIGWFGLGVAITASVVYSGGTAAPLWVKAGLLGLAALEVAAFVKADDPFNASIAAVAGFGDVVTAVRLIRNGRAALNTSDLHSISTVFATRDELVEIASRSTIEDLRRLAAESHDLSAGEFLDRYAEILAANRSKLAQDLVASGRTPAEAAAILDEVRLPDRPPLGDGTIRATDADLVRLDDPTRRPSTTARTDGKGRTVTVTHSGPYANVGDEVSLINSRNVVDGKVTSASGQVTRFDDDGFPIFNSRFDLVLDSAHYGSGDGAAHFEAANRQLHEAIVENPSLVDEMGLNDEQLAHIWPDANGRYSANSPPDLTWHHHQDTGRMQLVERVDHDAVGHTGGMSIWGGGRPPRRPRRGPSPS
jgi:hypothetical protein